MTHRFEHSHERDGSTALKVVDLPGVVLSYSRACALAVQLTRALLRFRLDYGDGAEEARKALEGTKKFDEYAEHSPDDVGVLPDGTILLWLTEYDPDPVPLERFEAVGFSEALTCAAWDLAPSGDEDEPWRA